MTFRLAAAVLAALLIAAGAHAQSAGAFMHNPAFKDPAPARCETTFDMQHCAAHELRIADAAMSARYSALRARLGASARQRLLVEQRQWLAARDRDCVAMGDRYRGGTMAPVVVAQCWVERTKARAKILARR
ncbi:lysozyme inhibitor LprI family protein [Sphingomonas sp. KR3-1]|uniref:lysozyme inhibitor LprI family protein n=1 Tax=Sphingomonas sp. KR3-1 TaxID=3156611 RepID=UPI0032B4D6B9